MISQRRSDEGQAFPVYIVLVAGVLFAALAFFVVGQASVTRSDAQGAADAAALAAAGDARDHLAPGLDLLTLKPEQWEGVLDGELFDPEGGCASASDFAAKNDAQATCSRSGLSFTVGVTTNGTVGKSVVPGTDAVHGTANATAVIRSRCTLTSAPLPVPSALPSSSPSPSEGPPDKPGRVVFACKGATVTFDPSKPDPWRILARALFDVKLTD
ncbi:pilus assembly protein TadG-related protein [Streptomyces sp. DK15]|uniref:pilus assembly protein TadG-related protein n=1 Tax=Streptomyces sp. DK15 TaxID=2957499 RepID=UPI0029A4D14D|nr:pilus assembly protein TadG-related protein [Streptomyces sp. DK15]MDX2389738.1 pilus assembly protein TadG-related protein [Streptomyces sp. DK15]